jgi:hypothetical protein
LAISLAFPSVEEGESGFTRSYDFYLPSLRLEAGGVGGSAAITPWYRRPEVKEERTEKRKIIFTSKKVEVEDKEEKYY